MNQANPNIINLNRIQFASRILAAGLAICLPWCVWAVLHLPVGSSGVHEWLPEGRPERSRYEQFVKNFGNDQVVLISWDGCRVNDSRLVEFQEQLSADEFFSSHIAKLESSDQLMRQLTEPPLSLRKAQAVRRLKGVMIGADGTAAVLARITTTGVKKQNETIEMIERAADRTPGLTRKQLRLAGTVYEAYAVDAAAEGSLKKLVLPSGVLGILVAWICLAKFRSAIVVLVLAGVGQLLAVAMVYYTGNRFSAVLIVLPTLVFMLTLSGAVHLMNYHSACLRRNLNHAGARALLLGWKPCALSSITTMLGMGSLWTSQLAPVRQFGLFSAVGLGVATVVLLVGFPAFADWFCTPRSSGNSSNDMPKSEADLYETNQGLIGHYLKWMARNATRISTVGILLLVITCIGLARLKASTKFSDMFPEKSKTNEDMAWIESNLGPIATVEVLLNFPAESTLNALERARWVSKVSTRLLEEQSVGGVFSAVSLLPNWSDSATIVATAKRAILRKEIQNALPRLVDQGLVAQSDRGEVWRIMAKVSATSDEDYGQLTRIVANATNEVLRDAPAEQLSPAEFTGLSPVMHETQVALLTDLGYSFVCAFVMITPVMMFVVRSIPGGLLIMLPNILPVTIAFGCMGWTNIDLDIAGILTASIALGIAVDDTLHFVCWYMDELRSGHSRQEAVARTFQNCSAAMAHTTLISCVSMAPFLFAEFIPTQQFAKLMIVMLSGAIVGDLVLLPALLLSPMGKFIGPSKSVPIEEAA